ncbi:cryptococcal mannosyltransferase 1-domain-containing protein [Phellopilus nigrolimitatus]|nr:cryptococcal mannosyltransferase 1-domain-containing protein [Phellopilus nigrolimitatus]
MSPLDQQSVLAGIEQLLTLNTLNGWVAALCPSLSCPFSQSDNVYDKFVRSNKMYFVGMVIHSADHFLVDQLAVIVQMARRIGTQSMLYYDSLDSTETLLDLCKTVLTLPGMPFRIRKVPPMTEDPAAVYYPLEEAHTRNLVLELLYELYHKRKVKFHRVWLKGFTCPNDIFETIMVSLSQANDTAMVCGMDWAEHNGFFIFSGRWRMRDINGDQFRQSTLSSAASAGPLLDPASVARFAQHLPFQVFCCESGTHVVDPAQTYYTGLRYHAGAQAYFRRDLWLSAAREGVRAVEERAGAASKAAAGGGGLGLGFNLGWGTAKPMEAAVAAGEDACRRHAKRTEESEEANRAEEDEQVNRAEEGEHGSRVDEGRAQRQQPPGDLDANLGSDLDAMPDTGEGEADDATAGDVLADVFSIPNGMFRILVNLLCMTTCAGVSHAQLALDLFRTDKDEEGLGSCEKYVLDDWEGAPESFICQEQRYTGG